MNPYTKAKKMNNLSSTSTI